MSESDRYTSGVHKISSGYSVQCILKCSLLYFCKCVNGFGCIGVRTFNMTEKGLVLLPVLFVSIADIWRWIALNEFWSK